MELTSEVSKIKNPINSSASPFSLRLVLSEKIRKTEVITIMSGNPKTDNSSNHEILQYSYYQIR